MSAIQQGLAKMVAGESLSQAEARDAMRELVAGEATPAQIAAFIVALRMKGETPEEIAGLAESMRDAATRVHAPDDAIDIVGTGGDNARTFNISTLSAFVVAAAGGRVAKHGNRAMTSACGAADFLEALGVAIELPPEAVATSVAETGFGFMFAPGFHPAMRHAVGPRREIGVRTVFNILGPLSNPARVRRQLTGVAAADLGRTLASVLGLMGSTHALVVHGEDGLDELSLAGPSQVHEMRDGDLRSYSVTPEQFGLSRAPTDAIRGGDVEANLRIASAVLDGQAGPPRDVLLLNAGAGLYVAGLADSIGDGVQQAASVLDSGRVRAKIEEVASVTQRLKPVGAPA